LRVSVEVPWWGTLSRESVVHRISGVGDFVRQFRRRSRAERPCVEAQDTRTSQPHRVLPIGNARA